MAMASVAPSLGEATKMPDWKPPILRSPAAARLAPGVIFVTLLLLGPLAILFRYSFNRFVPGELMVNIDA
ncbi:MAG: hypothetical protein IPK59_23185 [Rhodospirillaceae bacterium]|nr:hypothetical protein [Rhodospirillaceae bacterium]